MGNLWVAIIRHLLSGVEKLVSRVAHNHETAGAEPATATTRLGCPPQLRRV